jgi:glycosyltransferase involved in cell wall biosynthesis
LKPKVTFVVPCYKLAHLLPDCIQSILAQTYHDFEILIMDDASPDNTPEVARSFVDPRVKHIRNDPNLGHLRNYNKGIQLALGDYIWLISADDRLRSATVLERYVQLMDSHPRMGYVFCRGFGLENGRETGIVNWGDCGNRDAIWHGKKFLASLLESNRVLAASGMVRKECYEKITLFPLDLPYAGDWYLWCIFAFYSDVGYFAEPMVSYRLHELSMTNTLPRRHRIEDNLAVRWRMKRLAQQNGQTRLVQRCVDSLAKDYNFCVVSNCFDTSSYSLTQEEFERSLQKNTDSVTEQRRIRALVFAGLGDGFYHRGNVDKAEQYYRLSLQQDRSILKIWLKYARVRTGILGMWASRARVLLRGEK